MNHNEKLDMLFEESGFEVPKYEFDPKDMELPTTNIDDILSGDYKKVGELESEAGKEEEEKRVEDYAIAGVIDKIVDISRYLASQEFMFDGINNRNQFTINQMDHFLSIPARRLKICGVANAVSEKGGKDILQNFVDILKGMVKEKIATPVTWELLVGKDSSSYRNGSKYAHEIDALHFDIVAEIGKIAKEDLEDDGTL